MASLDKRENGYYRIRWYEDGKLKSMRFKPDNYKDSLDVLRQKEEKLQRAKSSSLRLSELWRLYKQARPRRNNEKHEEAYIKRALEFFSDCFIYEITEKSINEYKNWLLKQPNKKYKKEKVLLSSTYANACLKKLQANGLSIYEANIILRQSSIGMTERYSHLVPNQIDEQKVDFLHKEEFTYQIDNKRFKLNPMAPNIFQPIYS